MNLKKLTDNALWGVLVIVVLIFLYQKGIIFANFESVNSTQAKMMLKEGNASLLDVRTPKEFKHLHVKGAKLIPLDKLEKHLDELNKKTRIIVYCQSGNRSVSASRILSDNGFSVYNVRGGINAWNEQ
jgi:rhodanese-related sulfurtransferase